MSLKRERKLCQERVRTLEIPDPFDISEMCRLLSIRRGRPIHLLPRQLPTGTPCGLWIATGAADYIFYEENTSQLHQDHIRLHEIGHLLLEHRSTPALGAETSRMLLPNLDPQLVQSMLGRTHYSDAEEQQAELMASLILEQVSRRPSEQTWEVPPDAADVISRLEDTLQKPGGRKLS